MSDIAAIANELVALCREGRNGEAVEKFYADNIVTVESANGPDNSAAEQHGIQAVRNKGQWWIDNNDVHSAVVNGPFISADNQFAVEYTYDTTFKPTGARGTMHEMALYTVENGRIVHEHFFYNTH